MQNSALYSLVKEPLAFVLQTGRAAGWLLSSLLEKDGPHNYPGDLVRFSGHVRLGEADPIT